MRSKLVKQRLSLATSYFITRLVLVTGNNEIAGNCEADELAREGFFVSLTSKSEIVGWRSNTTAPERLRDSFGLE